MQSFVRGQRAELNLSSDAAPFRVRIQLQSRRVAVFDFVCFGVDASEQLSDDRFMVFFNQKNAPGGAISLERLGDHEAEFLINLAALPPAITRLVFTISVDGAGAMRDLDSGVLSLREDAGDTSQKLEYRFAGSDFQDEGALMLAAIYRRDNKWRFWAQGQGFAGNLNALLKHFGGEEAEESATPAGQPSAAASSISGSSATQPSAPISAPAMSSIPVIGPPSNTGSGSVQHLLAQAQAGSTVTLPRGEHQGPISIDKPLIVEGAGAVIWAQNGPVVTVRSKGVTLRNMQIETTVADTEIPQSDVALWVEPDAAIRLEDIRVHGEIVGIAGMEGDWFLPPALHLGEFAPRVENRFRFEIEAPHACEIHSRVAGVSLNPTQLQSGRQNVELYVQNVAADTFLTGMLELSNGGISRTIPLAGRSADQTRGAVLDRQLWTVEGSV